MTPSRRAVWLAGLAGLAGLVSCAAPPPAAPPWIELFDGHSLGAFVATEFGGEGPVQVRDGAIELGQGSPLTGVTWTGPLPTGDYELEVVAARTLGNDFFCGLTFPCRGSHLTLVLGGWGGAVCGFSCLDGLDAANNPTRTLRSFATDHAYTIQLLVREERAAAAVDGVPLASATLAGHTLGVRAEVVPSRPLGIASYLTGSRISRIRWRPLPPGPGTIGG